MRLKSSGMYKTSFACQLLSYAKEIIARLVDLQSQQLPQINGANHIKATIEELVVCNNVDPLSWVEGIPEHR